MLGRLGGAVPSREKLQASGRQHAGQKAGSIFPLPHGSGAILGNQSPLLLPEGCHPGKPALTDPLHCPESTQAIVIGVNWPLFSVRAALISLVNPRDHMVLFNEDPNLPKSQFKQRHLGKSLNPTLINCYLEKVKVFSAGWSEAV